MSIDIREELDHHRRHHALVSVATGASTAAVVFAIGRLV
jgi:hypothetical protein